MVAVVLSPTMFNPFEFTITKPAPGPPGATGSTGAAGPRQILSAAVSPDGSIITKSSAVTVARTGAGQYHIAIAAGTFTRPALPMFTPWNGHVLPGATTDFLTFADVTFAVTAGGAGADTLFLFTMTEVAP